MDRIGVRRVVSLVLGLLLLLSFTAAGCRQATRAPESEPEPAVWPLTGAEAPDEAIARRRVFSVKVENSPQARPQAGLNEADIVYELLTEGGITRFHALFQSKEPERVGPVRSARPPDIHIVGQFDSVLLFAGANRVVEGLIEDANIDGLTESTGGRALERDPNRQAPHNLYANISALRDVAKERGYETEGEVPELLFGEASVEASSAEEAEVTFNQSNQVLWRWDAGRKRYERWLNGSEHVDEAGKPFSAANVVVMFAEVVEGDREGTTDVRLDSSGDAIMYRDGKRFEGTWEGSGTEPPRFTVEGGEELPLAIGPTWIEVVPADQRSRFE